MYKKLIPPTPFFSAPLHERVEFFWYWVKEEYSSHNQNYTENQKEQYLQHLYKEGQTFGLILMDFNGFKSIMTRNNRGRGRRWGYRQEYWYTDHGVEFRERMSYGRRPHHKKKVLDETEIRRREWRETKGFNRDRQRKYYYGSRKKYAKKISNRSHRAMERQLLARQDWDLFIDGVPKDLFDPWMWD